MKFIIIIIDMQNFIYKRTTLAVFLTLLGTVTNAADPQLRPELEIDAV